MHVVLHLILHVSPLKHDHGMNSLSHVMAMELGRGVRDTVNVKVNTVTYRMDKRNSSVPGLNRIYRYFM